jgi:hypothetical protein
MGTSAPAPRTEPAAKAAKAARSAAYPSPTRPALAGPPASSVRQAGHRHAR